MSNPSNLYAEKIFAEHPTALWALDETIDYLSLISESNRDISAWELSSCTGEQILLYPGTPFPDSKISKLTGTVALQALSTIEASKELLTSDVFSDSKDTFSIGTFVYADHRYTVNFEIGYRYTDPITSQVTERSQYFTPSVDSQWLYISNTLKVPRVSASITVFFRATYSNDATQPTYSFYLNGFSIGQWNEEFQATSLGVEQSSILSLDNIQLGMLGIQAESYGLQQQTGYYTSDGLNLFAKNTSVPMVYGSSNVTRLFHNPDGPSLVLPSYGILSSEGQYKTFTLETWLRVESFCSEPRRIIGPINSTDGIYIDGPFIKVAIADQVGSHFLGETFRPMLVDLKIGNNFANLLVNGESVISLNFVTEDLDFTGASEDWLGFYAYEDVPVVELDAIAIYSYLVPAILAKRRFAFGQAVESPEGSNRSFGGQVAAVDYNFADYTNNYSYPDIGKWEQGILNNSAVINRNLSLPPYNLPDLFLESGSSSDWYVSQTDLQDEVDPYITFSEGPGYLLFDKFDLYNENTRFMYGFFSVPVLSEEDQILVRIDNQESLNYFEVSLFRETISYKIKFGNSEPVTLYQESGVVANSKTFFGIDIDNMISSFGENLSSFFGNRNQLKIYLGGTREFENTFTGKIYKLGLCSASNFNKISGYLPGLPEDLSADAGGSYFGNDNNYWSFFLDGGLPDSFAIVSELFNHIASYTLVPHLYLENLILDISVDSSWEDYQPVSYFAQYVKNIFGDYYYDIDFLQFNVDYPAPKTFDGAYFDTSQSLIKTYVTFQYIETGANAKASYFVNTESMPKNGIIEPGDNWMTTKYEVVNGAIIYPPSGIDVTSLAIVTNVEMQIDGIIQNPVVVKKIQYCSQAFNEVTSNPIGTRFGLPVFPFTRYGAFYDYKARNPYKIYKGSTPHLYLTRDSGLEAVGDSSPLTPRGFIVPVNVNAAPVYKVIGMQVFMRSNQDRFSTDPVELFEIQGTEQYFRVFMQANDNTGQRAKIYAIDSATGTVVNGIAFYLNGRIVREPVVSLGEWFALSIAFAKPFNFNEYVGAIRIVGPMLFNNVAFYESSALQELQRQAKRSWFGVSSDYASWLEVLKTQSGTSYSWNEILVISTTTYYGIDPSNIYSSYTGTNKIIIDDNAKFTIGNYQYDVLTDIDWQQSLHKPV